MSLTMTADLSALPQGNNAVFIVDLDPVITNPVTALGDVGAPISFTVSVADPDVDPILSLMADLTGLPAGNDASFTTNATFSSGAFSWTPSLADSGNYTVAFVAANALVSRANTTITVRGPALASAHTVNKKIQLGSNKPNALIVVQPVGGSFAVSSIILSTVSLVSPGTGTVSRLSPSGKSALVGDRDGDLVPDLTLSFMKSGLRQLFSLVEGTVDVPVTLEGQLLGGRHFLAPFTVTVSSGNGGSPAGIAPNPLNPQAKLTFFTQKSGVVHVRLFDLNGRLVRDLLDERSLPAGAHAITVDGRDRNGRPLASGVYYYRIEAPDGIANGRFAVVK
jgi:hypothetical protein